MEMPMCGSSSLIYLIIYPLQPLLRVRFELDMLLIIYLIVFIASSDINYHCRYSVCMEVFHHLWIHWIMFEPWTVYRRYVYHCMLFSHVILLCMANIFKCSLYALE